MATEHARMQAVPKPWGVHDLSPWSNALAHDQAIGEIRYERSDDAATDPSLLLKLLFTSEPLSIQVHPDDKFAHLMGLPNGKTEAWYVLSAAPDAKVALGLKRRLTPQQLREAIDDGSISDLIAWHPVSANDVISVAAGTIHAIGAGLVIAEIQQRSDVTFRLFDYGRRRELHVESGIAVATAGPAAFRARSNQLTAERQLLVSNPYFVFERINLAPNSAWCMEAERETWLLVLSGSAIAGTFDLAAGDALFAQSDNIDIHSGAIGMTGLAAYTGDGPIENLLRHLAVPGSIDVGPPREIRAPTSRIRTKAVEISGRVEAIK
ncbi:MAG TPA: mannose-6-phosphate isomerase [Xanthobacteraceae bacterium]|jgi:mannose-6-phosphate isomerase